MKLLYNMYNVYGSATGDEWSFEDFCDYVYDSPYFAESDSSYVSPCLA